MGKIKLVATDFDNTLVHYRGAGVKSSWRMISNALGTTDKDVLLYDAYHRGEIGYVEWCDANLKNFVDAGLTEQSMNQIFEADMELMPGTRRLYESLEAQGIKVAIISGGLRNCYRIFSSKFGIEPYMASFANEFFFDGSGRLESGKFVKLDYEGKTEVLKGVCNKLGISLGECAFVGDEVNDLHILGSVGLPVAINTQNQQVISAAQVHIKDMDISTVLEYL
ncbi:MAG: HAD family phosphatase [Candidatus Micrarchaeota archaeon]|nr:HAD family phosphatase [Candidatus Micrarchaeota archaeon]MDE1846822.1 HAD family phosphatase [Candidatus Micrarchaeota archaeon]